MNATMDITMTRITTIINHISCQNGGDTINENLEGVCSLQISSLLHAYTSNVYSPGGNLVYLAFNEFSDVNFLSS